MTSLYEQLPWQIPGSLPTPTLLRSRTFFSGCTRGRWAEQSQPPMENCFILIKHESEAC